MIISIICQLVFDDLFSDLIVKYPTMVENRLPKAMSSDVQFTRT